MDSEKAKKIKKYETMAMAIKMFNPKMKESIEEIAATFYQADFERQGRQMQEMKRNQRMRRVPKGAGDVQRKLDIGR